MLEEEFQGLQIDTEIDPMTAVAIGAGLFASTKKLPSTLKPKDLAKAQLNLGCADTSVESEEHVAVKLLRDETQGELPETIFIEINNADGTWKTGRSELEDDADVIMLTLSEGKQNVFNISLFDETGNRIASEPQQFSILQGMKIANAPLPFGVGIAVRGKRGQEFAAIEGLERNVTLPAEGQIALKTVEDKNPNNGDSLIFELYQGEHNDEGVSVETMEIISRIEVDSDELPGFIAKGTEVEVTIKVDESSRYSGEAYLTNLDESLDFDCPVVHLQTPSFEDLEQSISKAKAKLTMSEDFPAAESENALSELQKIQEELNESGEEGDTRERIKKSLQGKWKEIDRMEDQAEWPSIEKELDDAIDYLKELEKEYGDDDSLSKTFETQIKAVKERKDVKIAKNLVREISRSSFSYLDQQPGFYLAMIEYSDEKYNDWEWRNSTQARQAIDNARSAIRTDPSVENLRQKYFAIRDLMIKPENLGPGGKGGGWVKKRNN
jgi:molecular chaperone DnaK